MYFWFATINVATVNLLKGRFIRIALNTMLVSLMVFTYTVHYLLLSIIVMGEIINYITCYLGWISSRKNNIWNQKDNNNIYLKVIVVETTNVIMKVIILHHLKMCICYLFKNLKSNLKLIHVKHYFYNQYFIIKKAKWLIF